MIDLHLHTSASDGRMTPSALIAYARDSGLTIVSVTDHDTTAGLSEAAAACVVHGLRLVPGIEITAIENGRDAHVLGYFIDADCAELQSFLASQRAHRVHRVRATVDRLATLGLAIDADELLEAGSTSEGRTIGRPQIADALVAAGFASSRADAFDRLLGAGCPAYEPRSGVPVAEVVRIIAAAAGVSSLAHPAVIGMDAAMGDFATAGLDAIEVRHRDHDPLDEAKYRAIAGTLGLAVTGGSDFHADPSPDAPTLGSVTLPQADFDALELRALGRRRAS